MTLASGRARRPIGAWVLCALLIRPRPWRPVLAAGAALLVIAAGVLLLTTVTVSGTGERSASCGTGWDVVAGRTGWERWWAQDLADPLAGTRLVRTERCPDAVNTRIGVSGGLAGAAVVLVAAAGLVSARRTGPATGRLRVLGRTVTWLGAALTTAGLVGLALLTADPDSSLFLYVSRAAVFLCGLLLLLPAVLLVVLGRVLAALADGPGRREDDDEPA